MPDLTKTARVRPSASVDLSKVPAGSRSAVRRIIDHKDTPYQPEDRLTRHQAAEYLNVSLSRLAQLRRANEIIQETNNRTGRVRFRFLDVVILKVLRGEFIAEQDAGS